MSPKHNIKQKPFFYMPTIKPEVIDNFLVFKTQPLIQKVFSNMPKYLVHKNKGHYLITNLRGRKSSFCFPPQIKIRASTVGLIVGEGHIGKRRFVFGNSSTKQVEEILSFLSQFNLNYTTYLEISVKDNASNGFIEKAKIYWTKILNKEPERIRLRKEFSNTTKPGVFTS